MKIHADLSQRAVVLSDQLPWVDSPIAGVQRRMLERDGEEVARATSIAMPPAAPSLLIPTGVAKNILS